MRHKKQTDEQVLGRKGERWFQAILPPQWPLVKPPDDFGIDGIVFIADASHELSAISFAVQVKASREWPLSDGQIVLDVDSASVGLWTTLLMPVLLVLYDDARQTGFYSWVFDLLPSPPLTALRLLSAKATFRVRTPSEQRIDADCWPRIARDVARQVRTVAEALAGVNLTAAVLPTVHKLLEAFRTLYLAEHYWEATTDEQKNTSTVAEITAHREVMAALHTLRDKYLYDSSAAHTIDDFAQGYRQRLDNFVRNIDEAVTGKGETALVTVKHAAMIADRPAMLNMLLEISLALTTMTPGYEGIRFQGIEVNRNRVLGEDPASE